MKEFGPGGAGDSAEGPAKQARGSWAPRIETGAEPLRQVPFGREPGTLGHILADDQAADLVGKVVRHPGGRHGDNAREIDRGRALPG